MLFEMLNSEQDAFDLQKALMQNMDANGIPQGYLSHLGLQSSDPSPSESARSMDESILNGMLSGLINPQSVSNIPYMVDPQITALLEHMSAMQNPFMPIQPLPGLASNGQSPMKNSREAYCDLCDKNFCNRYFLKSHRLNKHGIDDGGSPVKGRGSPIGTEGDGQGTSVIVRSEVERIEGAPEKKIKLETENDDSKVLLDCLLSNSTSICDECSLECSNPIGLLHHKATVHSGKTEGDIQNGVKCPDCDLVFDSPALLTQHSLILHGGIGNILGMLTAGQPSAPFPAGLFMPSPMSFSPIDTPTGTPCQSKVTPAKRSYSSAGKNYCDVCNKEVCNKYFLRTHMLKMHGIVIDENKPVIANIDTREKERTGELSFRCDICSTELKSRQQLKEHKQSSHGVSYPMGGTSPVTPRPPQKNPLTFPPSIPQSTNGTLDLSIGSIVSQSECTLIPSTVITSIDTPINASKEKDNVAKCHHCMYRTRFTRNMEYHVERHERLNDIERGREDDEVMGMTAQVAIQMARNNQREESLTCHKCAKRMSTMDTLMRHVKTFHSIVTPIEMRRSMIKRKNIIGVLKGRQTKNGEKKSIKREKSEKENESVTVERNSHTSGSLSPLRSDVIPDGISSETPGYSLQPFSISSQMGPFPIVFSALLPVSAHVASPITLSFTLSPLSS